MAKSMTKMLCQGLQQRVADLLHKKKSTCAIYECALKAQFTITDRRITLSRRGVKARYRNKNIQRGGFNE